MGSTDIFCLLLSKLDQKDRAEVAVYMNRLLAQKKYKSNVLEFRKDGKTYGQTDRQAEDPEADKKADRQTKESGTEEERCYTGSGYSKRAPAEGMTGKEVEAWKKPTKN